VISRPVTVVAKCSMTGRMPGEPAANRQTDFLFAGRVTTAAAIRV
jgi:hypothetical protein